MFRPTSFSRATVAVPTRCLFQQQPVFLGRRFLSTQPAAVTATTTKRTPPPPPPPAKAQSPAASEVAEISTPEAAATAAPKPTLPFSVGRTPSKNYPIYELAKRGGNKKLTTIKKVVGDRIVFRKNVARGLGLSPSDVKLSTLTGHFQVAGHYKKELEEWFSKQGI